MNTRLATRRRSSRRSVVAAALLLATLAGSVGVPVAVVPAPEQGASIVKDASTPFPCQHRRCGCQNAAACWKKCCCFTHAQKLAWAKKNNVPPPRTVEPERLVAARSPQSAASAPAASKPAKSCCANKTRAKEIATADAAPLRFQLVVAEQRRECGGLGAITWILSQALPPEFSELPCDSPPVVDRLVVASEHRASRSDSPSLRPPRICG